MNLVDRSLQKQLPNNALLMISASLGVLFSSIEMIFIHMDILMVIGLSTFFISLELFFSAYNFLWKEVHRLIPLCLVAMIANIVVGLYLILMREVHCEVATNYDQCFAFSAMYGAVIIVSGAVIYGFSAVLAYYFYRLFPTSETRGLQLIENHIFNEEDLMRRVEQYDHMKRPSELHVGVQNPLSVL
ncbi:hypothetical protein WA588_003823, partial [Blastocystis sp. NMH]